jgi:hypothetical protein
MVPGKWSIRRVFSNVLNPNSAKMFNRFSFSFRAVSPSCEIVAAVVADFQRFLWGLLTFLALI